MSPVVIGHDFDVSHPRGNGKWWLPDTLYLHSLLFDPFILTRTTCIPIVLQPSTLTMPDQALLIYAHAVTGPAEVSRIQRVVDSDGAVVLNQPKEELLASLPSFSWVKHIGQPIASLRERWNINSPRTYHFSDQQSYACIDPSCGQVLSWIGDHPDLIVHNQTAMFAGNPWPTVLAYLNTPVFSRLLLDMANLLVRLTANLTQCPITSHETEQLAEHIELRRDFHAFGFAAFTIEQLERSLDVSAVDLRDAYATVIDAAKTLTAGNSADAQQRLGHAFQLLERENRKLQPHPAVFTDTLHAGGLFDDMGYCEFDWPQHAADVLSNHLDWVENRGYRLNLDFAAKSLEHLSERFPKLFARLRTALSRRQVELVNGTWNQPYPPFFGLESILRQFDLGIDSMQKILHQRPITFASQEFSFAPQLASVLAKQGFSNVVLRVQNMGDAPVVDASFVQWIAPNGDRVLGVPSHRYKSEQLNEVTYNNLHLKLFAGAMATTSPQVFSGLGDITYYRPFREELARTAHYANVFGRFSTWTEHFRSLAHTDAAAELRTSMEDFDCRAAFLEISRWEHLRRTGGGSIAHSMRSTSASELFRAAEILDTITSGATPADETRDQQSWRALAAFQGHDRYFSPLWPVGGFMGSAFNPTRRIGRIEQTVADYCGPIDTTTIGDRAGRDLRVAEKTTKQSIHRRLASMSSEPSADVAWMLFNPGPAAQRIVKLRKAAGRSLQASGCAIVCQDDGEDLLAAFRLPGYSCSTAISAAEQSRPAAAIDHPVQCGDNYLDNGLVRVELDMDNGTITRLLRPSDGRLLLLDSHKFIIPGGQPQLCRKVRWHQRGPLKTSVDFHLSIPLPGKPPCQVLSRVSLEAGQTWIDLTQRVIACPAIRGDQWQEHLGLSFQLPDEQFTLRRSHYNVLEDARARNIFSHNLLIAELDDLQVGWMNRGNQFYVREGHSIRTILICENEPARTFRHRVGWPSGNPLFEARSWLTPWFIRRCSNEPSGGSKVRELRRAIEISSEDVELLSLRHQGDILRVRLANLSGKDTSTHLSVSNRFPDAWITDLTGKLIHPIQVTDGAVAIALRPWDIVQVEFGVSPRTPSTKAML